MRFLKLYSLYLTAFLTVGLVFPACNDKIEDTVPVGKQVSEYDHSAVRDWNEMFLEVERYAAGFRPCPAPRALAYIGLANYEACISAMPAYRSLAPLYSGLSIPRVQNGQEYHWPTVINASYARLMHNFFIAANQGLQDKMNGLEAFNESKYKEEVSAEVFDRSKQYGLDVANGVWEWSKTDLVAHDSYLDPFANYDWSTNFLKPGDWVPTPPGPAQPMYPHAGEWRTFAIKESDKICPAPWAYGETKESRLYAEALDVYARNINASYEEAWIAEFWSDDLVNLTFSPGPRWMAIADEVLNLENSNLETAVYMAAKMGMALNDAAVACWKSKYFYNVERPVSYIQRLIDPTWKPHLSNPINQQIGFTPPFPAYPSGHSTMGGAGAEILTSVFGISYAFTDRCHETRTEFKGAPRTFESFYQAAEENAESRIPLGVHYRMDSEQGVSLGYRCARRVNQLPWEK